MKERPILFSAPMVRAILAGTKTQTRRVVKPQHIFNAGEPGDPGTLTRLTREYGAPIESNQYGVSFDCDGVRGVVSVPMNCPYGAPGDRLWVRETWGRCDRDNVIYRADDIQSLARERHWVTMPTWKPSIHMPRWASRITLEVASVRVERLHAITEEDARAEGVWYPNGNGHCWPDGTARRAFTDLWRTINGAESWDANPWVWVVEFKRIEVAP